MTKDAIQFFISYDGEALTQHQMDVKDLAPALLAMGELFEEANRLLNGEHVKIHVNMKAPRQGSVEVLLCVVQNLIHHTKSLFNSDSVNAIINAHDLLKILGIGASGGVIGLIKWLKNRKIKSVTKIEMGNFKITTEDNDVRIVNEKEIKLFSLLTVRKKLEAIIKKPLEKEGVDVIRFGQKDQKQEIKKEEIEYFSSPPMMEEVIDEKEYTENLQIVTITFAEDGKWKFFDGNNNFFAEILDEDFLAEVKKNEKVFAHDDILHVKLKRIQSLSEGKIKNSYTIINVLDHRSAAVQIKLPFSDEDQTEEDAD